MTVELAATLAGLGLLGAFVSGLLGVGGAIVVIPLLLYVPPLLGVGQLDMKSVAGITMVQVFIASLSGVVAHRRTRSVHPTLAWVSGTSMAAGSFLGAYASRSLHDDWLLLVFALMSTVAGVLMLCPLETIGQPLFAEQVTFSAPLAAAIAGGVGVAAGLVGAGGAFLLVPLLLFVVGIPIRVTIGSSLGIVALSSTAGLAGKLLTDQVPALPSVLVALGALGGAQAGAWVSHRVSGARLKQALAAIIAATALRVWWDVLVP